MTDLAIDVWADVVGQERAVAQLRAAAAAPVHAYLLVGPRGSGKRAAARAFAAELLSAGTGGDEATRHLQLALAEQHPDLVVVEPEGARISADQARDIVTATARTPVEAERKVLVLCDMHRIEVFGAMLLKSIEEPPPSTVFVILAEEVVPDLITIASRCVRVELSPVPAAVIADRLVDEGVGTAEAEEAAAAAAGDLGRARLLATDPLLAERRRAWHSLPEQLDGTGATAARLVDHVRGLIDRAQAPLEARLAEEVDELDARIARYGQRGSGARELEARHRRERRRLRTDELRFGLSTLAGRYRDELATADRPRPLLDALAAIQAAAEALIRNPAEELLLVALLFELPALAPPPT